MKNTIAVIVSLLFACGAAYGDEAKSDAKKSEKAKTHAKKKSEKKSEKKSDKKSDKSAQKSDKNAFQKTESSIGDWADRNKLWVRSHKKDEKK